MGLIEVRDLFKGFDDVQILNGINLSVEKGTAVVILGKSGVGKSVLLKSIIGLMTPDAGSIIVDGQNIVGMPLPDLLKLRRRMGYLFQGAALYDSMSVRENLSLALRQQNTLTSAEIADRTMEHLRVVGLEGAIDKMPSELSGGMKKRAALARALITHPEIMLYDEPTTGLDPITSREISQLIHDLQERFHVTSVAVTHDMLCARIIADKLAVLSDGLIHHEGTIRELEKSKDEFIQSFFETH